MKGITIFGSCVSRDVFRVAEYPENINYFARSSLISLMSEPLSISNEDIKLESDFQKNMVLHDFRKDFFEETWTKGNFIVIDFIDERFDVMKYGKSYVTCSNEFVNGKVIDVRPFERVSRFQQSTHELWKKSCLLFFDRLLAQVSNEDILIHETYWAKNYIENGQLNEFPNHALIKANNKMLEAYYGFLRSTYPGLRFVSAPRTGNKDHTWGLSPVHYTDEYYLNIYDQIMSYNN